MVDKKFVLKVSIDGKNKEKIMPVFNVLRLANDPDIIKSVCEAATPAKVNLSIFLCYILLICMFV